MKARWESLSDREKQTVAAGSALAAVFLLYALIWAPLSNSVANLRDTIQHDQALLTWMQASDKRITELEKTQHSAAQQSAVSLLSLTQTEINKMPFASAVSQLQQADNDSVQLQMKKVAFDSLMKWLISFCQQHQVIVTQMTATPAGELGVVDIDLKLSSSG